MLNEFGGYDCSALTKVTVGEERFVLGEVNAIEFTVELTCNSSPPARATKEIMQPATGL